MFYNAPQGLKKNYKIKHISKYIVKRINSLKLYK